MAFCVAAFLLVAAQFAPTATGELRVIVTDSAGLPLASTVELVSEVNQLREQLETNPDGTLVARRLPFGTYRIAVNRDGFATFTGLVEIRSALPTDYRVTLGLAPLQTELTVRPEETLLNPQQTTAVQRIGTETLQRRTTALPGRALLEMVDAQPGWLLEANGVLHPRGSEYQTQYVVDGLPLTDNRSPAFAPALDADDVHTMNVLTAGYPAEYGRKLGGIIEVVTGGQGRRGFHGSATGSVGTFDSQSAGATAGFGFPRTTLSFGGGLAGTDRYLDPPVEANYTNRGTSSYLSAHLDHDIGDVDRVGVIVRYGRARFAVPNELIQEEGGQRQERDSEETTVQFSHQHIFTGRTLVDVRGMARTLSSGLQSNDAATPIIAEQDRGLRELYLKAAVSVSQGVHELKTGGELTLGTIREQFGYDITDPSRFDSEAAPSFAFSGRSSDREQALFLQDRISRGPWTVNIGARWDHYRVVVDRHALSPRFGVAWSWPRANLVLRGSYDRAFETPAVENLLLGSSDEVESLSDDVVRLPVQPSVGNFYEAGISKALFGTLRLDATYFRRAIANFADDDVLMNTGVSFPVAFRRATIKGAEIKIDLPRWRRLSGFASYALLHGVGLLPITGGLFIGDNAEELLESVEEFPISQDQRHTIRGRATYQVTSTAWIALAAAYGSGLPVELEGDRDEAEDAYGERIVSRVDFEAGRVRPNFSLDASAGMVVARTADRSVQLQADVRNLTNRLNVINFAGLFSGTALAPPRSVAVRVRVDF